MMTIMMMCRLSQYRRITLATLLVWWCWSAMAVCLADIAVGEHGGAPSGGPGNAAHMAHEFSAPPPGSEEKVPTGAQMPCHDGVASSISSQDANGPDCCDQAEMLRIDHSADTEFPILVPVASWLNETEPVGTRIVPYVYEEQFHDSRPRLHLLLSVFLD